jgi:hypothetical protein
MGEVWASCCGGCRAVDQGRGSQVESIAAGPGLTSTSPEEQRRSRIRVLLKAIRTGLLVHSEKRVKGAVF